MPKTLRFHKCAILFSLLLPISAVAQPVEVLTPQADYREGVTQRQVVDLLIGEAKASGDMGVVVDRLQKAYALEPYRADLLFSIANAYVYKGDIGKAADFYRKIVALAPEDVDAHTYLAVWGRYLNDRERVAEHLQALERLSPGRFSQARKLFAVMDDVGAMPIRDHLSEDEAQAFEGPVAIVALGYALNADGTMHETLVQRLEKTLELARQMPEALIVVTGGVPKNSQTEGALMARWLVERGVEANRIYQDNYARSTVENALFSRYALAKHGIRQAVIVSSGSHVRRAQTLFTVASWESGPQDIRFTSVAAFDRPQEELQTMGDGERQAIYRDALKTMGMWSFRSTPWEER